MLRTARAALGNWCYHVLNRGNARAEVFHKPEDYAAFVGLFAPACERISMRLVGWCLMPNHFHLVLWPRQDEDLGRWMQWLLTSHVRRYHKHYHSSGHVWQGRFKAFPIQQDEHFLTVLRYAERNALRAGLVKSAGDWLWGSLHSRTAPGGSDLLAPPPVPLSKNWPRLVNEPHSATEVAAVRASIVRGRPFGNETWTRRAATKLGLESTLRPRGRPRKTSKK